MSSPANKILGAKCKELAKIFVENGANSAEFVAQVKNFIVFVQIRYMGEVVEDLTQIAYLRILQSIPYYKPGKTNIGTWVFSVTRNQVSSYLHHKKKRMRESEDELPFIVERTPHWQREYELKDSVDAFYEVPASFIIDFGDDVQLRRDALLEMGDNVFRRAFLWEQLFAAKA